MPRARTAGKMIRIPVPPEIAYDLTYFYPPKADKLLLLKWAEKLQEKGSLGLAANFKAAYEGQRDLTPKQRLTLLMMENPQDLRLRVMKQQIEQCSGSSKRWGATFRRDPHDAYRQEALAVLKALKDWKEHEEGAQRLEEVLCRD